MKKGVRLVFALLFLVLSVGSVWAVMNYDVQAIGPNGSSVGFASINKQMFEMLGTNDLLYEITDLIGKLSLGIVAIFALTGFIQLVSRKSFKKVDKEIYGLALLYIFTVGVYVLFEKFIINYRPVLIDGVLEASFPSSHTMLACVIFGSTIFVLDHFLKNKALKGALQLILWCLIIAMIAGRLLSGVHWFTDICAGVLFSITLLLFFLTFIAKKKEKVVEEEDDETLVYKTFNGENKKEEPADYVDQMIYEQKTDEELDEDESKRRLEECLNRLKKEMDTDQTTAKMEYLLESDEETVLLPEDDHEAVIEQKDEVVIHYEPIDDFDVSFYINILLEGKTIVPIIEIKKVEKDVIIHYEPIDDFDVSFYLNILLEGKTIVSVEEKILEEKVEESIVEKETIEHSYIDVRDIDYEIASNNIEEYEDEVPLVECKLEPEKLVIEIKEIF